jgi:nicotinate-nucleotide adenylyltransferase
MSDAESATPRSIRKLGIFGGTFDPIHRAHLAAAQAAVKALQLDRLLFVVAGRPWQKQDRQVAAPEHRLAMVRAATAGNPVFAVSDMEVARSGLTYTLDTVRALREQYPDAELYLLVGADVAATISTWKGLPELRRQVTLAVIGRPPYRYDEPTGFTEVRVPFDEESLASTQVRDRLAAGESVAGLVPEPALTYLERHRLYR